MKKLGLYVCALCFFFSLSKAMAWGLDSSKNENFDGAVYQKIDIQGEDHKHGIFDISVEYGDDGVGWMAYSRIEIPKYVETRLAKSLDQGKSWHFVSVLNKSHLGDFSKNGKLLKGSWRYEVPSLLYDPEDTPLHRWKLFTQKAFLPEPYKRGKSLWGESWIDYRSAPSPTGPWSDPVALLGAKDGKAKVNISRLHPDLKDMKFYGEVGSIVVDGAIYISLDAAATESALGQWKKRKTILLASDDHAKTWRYVGDLTDYDDASHLGYLVLTGSSLVREKGKIYYLVTPSGKKGLFSKKHHDGTYVIPFEDLSKARLKRDEKGNLVILKTFKPALHSGGLSDYDEKNVNGGILFSQINMDGKTLNFDFFQAFSTQEKIRP